MTKGKYTVHIEAAIGYQTYECSSPAAWVDMQSSTYLVLSLVDGKKLMINDFNVRSVLEEKN
jgi:hypothetical protein